MSNRIESFPMLNENIASELNINLKSLEGKYIFNNITNKLEIVRDEENDNEFILDNNGIWKSEVNKLCIFGKLEISNYKILFEKYKLAQEDTILGLALTYISKGSTKTYTKPIAELSYFEDDEKVIDFYLDFEAGELSSMLTLNFSIYVKEVKSNDNANIFAKNTGTMLGEIYSCNVIIEGQGSEFPIVIVENPEGPLWDMDVDFESLDDVFSVDTICMKINKAHKSFSKLGIDKISGNNTLIWQEILASFFTNLLLVAHTIENLESILNQDIEEGTVGGFLKFMMITFNISQKELKNPTILSAKIRKELDNLL